MSKPTYEDMIRRAHTAIFRNPHWCWLSQVLMLGKWQISDDKLPPRTDGLHVTYPKWRLDMLWDMDGDKSIRYIVIHENLHKALRHLSVWKHLWKKNPMIASQAVDHVVQLLIAETTDFASIAPDAIQPTAKYRGWNSQQVFNDLMNQQPQKKQQQQSQSGGKGEADDGDQEEGDDGDTPQDAQRGIGDDEHMPTDQFTDADGNPIEDNLVDQMIQAAVSQGIFMQRQKHPELARKFGDLTAPQVDYKTALRRWLSARQWGFDRTNWRRPSRRGLAHNIQLPVRYDERKGKLMIAVDTSGSVYSILTPFMSEVRGIIEQIKPKQIELVYWGSHVVGHETWLPQEYHNLVAKTRPMDGGGTDLQDTARLARELDDLKGVIILTDGEISGGWRQWPCPVFVVLTQDSVCPFPNARIYTHE